MNFRDIPITVDPNMEPGCLMVRDTTGRTLPVIFKYDESPTDEHRIARQVADRLLNRTGPVLTLEIMQRAVDTVCNTPACRTPHTIIMSPATRREYLALLEPDRRYT